MPLCPVDKEVIKSHEVRKPLLWVSKSLVDREASILVGHRGWSRRAEGGFPWGPYSSAEGSGRTPTSDAV